MIRTVDYRTAILLMSFSGAAGDRSSRVHQVEQEGGLHGQSNLSVKWLGDFDHYSNNQKRKFLHNLNQTLGIVCWLSRCERWCRKQDPGVKAR